MPAVFIIKKSSVRYFLFCTMYRKLVLGWVIVQVKLCASKSDFEIYWPALDLFLLKRQKRHEILPEKQY